MKTTTHADNDIADIEKSIESSYTDSCSRIIPWKNIAIVAFIGAVIFLSFNLVVLAIFFGLLCLICTICILFYLFGNNSPKNIKQRRLDFLKKNPTLSPEELSKKKDFEDLFLYIDGKINLKRNF